MLDNIKRVAKRVASGVRAGAKRLAEGVKRGAAAVIVGGGMVIAASAANAQTTQTVVEQIEGIKDSAESIFNACVPIVVAVVSFGILIGFAKVLKRK